MSEAIANFLVEETAENLARGMSPEESRRLARIKFGNPQQIREDLRPDSKKALVLELMRRKDGATLPELMAATGWMAHSVRGFISGTVGKKLGLAVESSRNGSRERCYKVAK